MSKKIRSKKILTEEEIAAQEAEEQIEEEIEVQDDFQAKGFEIAEWAQEQSGKILAAIGAVVVIAIAYTLLTMNGGSKNIEAAGLFKSAQDIYQAGISETAVDDVLSFKTKKERAEASVTAFDKLVSEANGSDVMPLAHLYKGHSARDQDLYEEAIKAYETFLSTASQSNPLQSIALNSIATSYMSLNQVDKAVATFDKLLQLKGNSLKDYTLLKVAKLKIKQGKGSEAKNYIDQLKEKHSESSFVEEAKLLEKDL